MINYKRGKPAFNKLLIKFMYTLRIWEIIFYFFRKKSPNMLPTRRIHIKGSVPKKEGILVAAHHEEWDDAIIIIRSLRRRLNGIAATETYLKNVLKNRFLRKFIDMAGIISIHNGKHEKNKGLFDYVAYLLEIGEAIVIFPEGNLRGERGNKRLGKAKDGVIRIAQFTQKKINKKIPIYPIGMDYKKKKYKKEAYVRIGNPFFVSNTENSKKAMSRLMKEIARLSNIKNG